MGLPLTDKQVDDNFNNFLVNVEPSVAKIIPTYDVDPISL